MGVTEKRVSHTASLVVKSTHEIKKAKRYLSKLSSRFRESIERGTRNLFRNTIMGENSKPQRRGNLLSSIFQRPVSEENPNSRALSVIESDNLLSCQDSSEEIQNDSDISISE